MVANRLSVRSDVTKATWAALRSECLVAHPLQTLLFYFAYTPPRPFGAPMIREEGPKGGAVEKMRHRGGSISPRVPDGHCHTSRVRRAKSTPPRPALIEVESLVTMVSGGQAWTRRPSKARVSRLC
jgi:hypothetical protein